MNIAARSSYGAAEIKSLEKTNTARAFILTLAIFLLALMALSLSRGLRHIAPPFTLARPEVNIIPVSMKPPLTKPDSRTPPAQKGTSSTRKGPLIERPELVMSVPPELANPIPVEKEIFNPGPFTAPDGDKGHGNKPGDPGGGEKGSIFGSKDGDGKGRDTSDREDNKIHEYVEKEPSFDMGLLTKNLVYPRAARNMGLEGTVMLDVLIGKDGMVKKVTVAESSNSLFEKEAVEAVRKMTFTPGEMDNKKVQCVIRLPISFRLR